ncbi:UNVERIFIED_CONTAM: hypothetical protein HDU68_010844 [Siphonaria sp. JEL0065]|nr:hypothetical protein HDU68_010844 [Siphonaria sp. JEL0065]
MQIGFVGLGAMGLPMAINIQKGLNNDNLPSLRVWNRTASKAAPVQELGAIVETSLESIAKNCQIFFAMTFDDAALQLTVDTIVSNSNSTSKPLFISCSTVAPSLIQSLSAKYLAKITILSAPVFGRPDAALNKQLVAVLAGGTPSEKDIVSKYLQYTTRKITILNGPAHTANVLKLTGNFCIASLIDMLAQAQTLSEKNGVPREAVVDVVSSLFPGPIVGGYSSRIAVDDFGVGFTVDGGLKDVGLMQELARESGVCLPFADVVKGHLDRQKGEDPNLDWSSIARVVRKDSGL